MKIQRISEFLFADAYPINNIISQFLNITKSAGEQYFMQAQFHVKNFTRRINMKFTFLISFLVILVTPLLILGVGIWGVLALDEEIHQESNDSDISRDTGWANYDEDILSISTVTDSPLSGNGSMKVDVKPALSSAETNSSWSILSTEFIPITEDQYYNYSLEVTAKDVNQLHSKVIYYDSNKNEINSDFIFGGRDGTFEDKISNSFLAPNGTKYVQIQLWVRPTLDKNASYVVDDVELQSLPRGWVGWINYDEDNLSISTVTDSPLSGNGSMKVDVKPALSSAETNSSWSKVSTEYIPITEITEYGLNLDVSAKNVNQLHSKVIYYDSNKNEINSDFIFGGRDGTFEDKISNSFLAPNGTKYVQIQLWVRPTLEKRASYVVDNVELSVPR
jgi:hypothetical protein